LRIKALLVGSLATNCYIAYCEENREAAIIDPGGDADRILSFISKENLKVKFIVNTHGHADHILADDELRKTLNAPLLIHQADLEMLSNPELNLSAFLDEPVKVSKPDRLLKGGDEISFGKVKLKVIHTPGHTPGCICLLGENSLFSGDTLFAGSVGRTDIPGGSFQQLMHSLKFRIMPLPDSLKVYPGHGPETVLGYEKHANHYLKLVKTF
jgi:glyoxylase-like metal-dependent hydrolase (beta-lactamase superfamily II)